VATIILPGGPAFDHPASDAPDVNKIPESAGARGRRGKILIEEAVLDAFLQSRKVEGKSVDASSLDLKHITLR